MIILSLFWQSAWCLFEFISFSRLFIENGYNFDTGTFHFVLFYQIDLWQHFLDLSIALFFSLYHGVWLSDVYFKVALTCMAKLRDDRFLCPGGLNSDNVACLDIISVKQLPNGACHSILFKLVMAILRHETSEALRRRYTFLDSYCCFFILIYYCF